MDRIFADIISERARQDKKWGVQDHSPSHWFVILAEEFGEVARAIRGKIFGQPGRGDIRTELIHLAAVAVAIIERIDAEAPRG